MTTQNRPLSLLSEGAAQAQMPENQGPKRPAPESILRLTRPDPETDDEYLHHIIIGSPKAVEDTIKLLHVLQYVENRRWTPLIPIREQGLRITPNEGQVLSYLVRQQPKRS